MERTVGTEGKWPGQQKAAMALWVALVVALSISGSLVFACAVPLAAIAALAATKMRVLDGLALVAIAWIANQTLGFVVLGYPQTWNSFAWGAAIGAATMLGFLGACVVAGAKLSEMAVLAAAFLAAFALYEAGLYAAAAILPSSEKTFSSAVVGHVFIVNVIAFAGLLLFHRLAIALSLLRAASALNNPASA